MPQNGQYKIVIQTLLIQIIFSAISAIPLVLVMPTWFFMIKFFTPGALDRKGPILFLKERFLRLGLFTVNSIYILYQSFGNIFFQKLVINPSAEYSYDLLIVLLDSGVLWFLM